MDVRKGTEDDIRKCVEIADELEEYFTDDALEDMRKDLKEHEFFVVDDDEISGFISLNLKNDRCAEVSWLAVSKERRGSGLGKGLMEHSFEYLSDEGVELLEVKTLSGDVDYEPYAHTRKFYEKMGFIHLETIDPYPGWEEGNPCAIYVKSL